LSLDSLPIISPEKGVGYDEYASAIRLSDGLRVDAFSLETIEDALGPKAEEGLSQIKNIPEIGIVSSWLKVV
jgi:hypothetical protein